MSLDAFVTSLVLSYLVVFARLGSALIFMPAFGEVQIPIRARLSFALVLCAALLPITPVQAAMPDDPVALALMLGVEVTIGLWIGLTARILLSALQFAGFQVGQVSGLANAFGPSFGSFEGATMVATLMLISAVAMIFITDTHHIILRALLSSYEMFPPGQIMLEDMTDQLLKAAGQSLYIGTAVAAPFFVMGVVLNLGMGLANRMMPQLPVFFVAASLLIGAGLLILAISMPALLDFFISEFQDWLVGFKL
ncbi:flagellar biosynthetic protein FliR [Sulfitobacter mediterraneus]|jgi:flagellar biosynthetic protein FliR|uniref:Flagellar biosynthesis protein n=1 Tax=Sulfitobacter mediterraneus TaxID=83219 RepID=A0A061SRI0_9RHOB|nr:flagellar biosynthetic protein FliR [Sulfitobacter mediterraneus]KAJ02029.1 flagellar biosynthesis protein [Sulfitobacter mediterraneus]KIN77143.1 Flagellar biosynthesis protein [Sulfitobacter mediterraneus KCTC 32188]MBM1558176.1 flagellar biosynthetic protein FliR [Sulfitobacter mediterraneus]MBM1570319.1 flagellar biosynthetic protein FliR [Sulfitobacter mediterraneus]MBM1573382.1 flagellar biosynthetic protein FliR [Sulfitobacter mediterraneus]